MRATRIFIAWLAAMGASCVTTALDTVAPSNLAALPREPLAHDPLALDTMRAEWRSIRLRLQRESPALAARTDGTRALSDTEWPLFARVYFALASCDLAELSGEDESARRALYEGAANALIEALEPRRIRWIHAHFGDPLRDASARPSAVVHGPVFYAIERCGPGLANAQLASVARALDGSFLRAFEASADGVLPSYRSLTWATDSVAALAAMALRAHDERATSVPWTRWKRTAESLLIERQTGLVVAPFNSVARRAMGPPRGSALMMAMPYLATVDAAFARRQWEQARAHLLVSVGDLAGCREFPAGIEAHADADSGRIVLGMGESASGFAILAAAAMGELALAERLARSAWAVSGARLAGERIDCPELPVVGHAIILAGKARLARQRAHARPP